MNEAEQLSSRNLAYPMPLRTWKTDGIEILSES